MKVFYSTQVQMGGTNEISDAVMESAAHHLGFLKKDIEEEETYSVSVLYTSEIKPTDMRERVRRLLADNPAVHYVDVMYRFEYAMVPDRFVIWQDGRQQDYTGYISFKEDV